MCPIGIKEAAAIGTQVLDKLQRRHRSLRNDLLRHLDRLQEGPTARIGDRIAMAVHAGLLITGWLQQRHRLIGLEVHRYALPDEQQPAYERKGQQHPEGRPREIDPKITQPSDALTDQATNECDADREPGCTGEEILYSQPDHLTEIAHGGLTAIGLPGSRGGETDGRIQRQVGAEGRWLIEGIKGVQERLATQETIEEEGA